VSSVGRLSSHGVALLGILPGLCGFLPACGQELDLGSDLIWFADHEAGDLGEWSRGGEGGVSADAPEATATLTTQFARSGRYSVKLINQAAGTSRTARLWREGAFPEDAYYSVWYYLPQVYSTSIEWTILQFRSRPAADSTVLSQLLDLDLRSLPGGELIVTLFDHRPQYLRAPTPDPPPVVPVGSWFHIEAFYRNPPNDNGRLTVWLNGAVIYDLTDRPMGATPQAYWTPCSISMDLTPSLSEIYVDDAAISLRRVTPTGILRVR
jgi:hypothetical protein